LNVLLIGVKLAPKFAQLGDDALKLTDDVAKKFDDAFEKTKGKIDDLAIGQFYSPSVNK